MLLSIIVVTCVLLPLPNAKSINFLIYQTKYGDILDCVEIDKQLAFDHPLLKNHSIQVFFISSSSRIL